MVILINTSLQRNQVCPLLLVSLSSVNARTCIRRVTHAEGEYPSKHLEVQRTHESPRRKLVRSSVHMDTQLRADTIDSLTRNG